MDHEAAELRREFSKLTRGHGRRYPEGLRARATTLAKAARRSGTSWSAIADAVGVNVETLRVWCRSSEQPKMRRVVIADEQSSQVTIVSPSGFRVEGLSMRDAIALLEKLG